MKYIYFFGARKAQGSGEMKDLLGGKGAGLAEMTRIGLPVPAGFTITTVACDYYFKHDRKHPRELAGAGAPKMKRPPRGRGEKLRDAKKTRRGCVRPGPGPALPRVVGAGFLPGGYRP